MSGNPSPDSHPKVHLWLLAERMSDQAGADLFGVSRQIVRLWRKPFSDPKRAKPGAEALMRVVMDKTRFGQLGPVCAADWFPPDLRAPPAGERGGDPVILRYGRAH